MEVQEAVGAAIANEDKIIYKDSTYELVSKVAYLIGVPRHIFENEHEAPQMEVFERLEADKAARIIRHLSICWTPVMSWESMWSRRRPSASRDPGRMYTVSMRIFCLNLQR